MVKMAPTDILHGLLEQDHHRMSEVALTITQGLSAAFKIGENHFPYVLPTRVNLIFGTFMQLFCMAMALSSAYRSSPHRNVCM